MRCTGSLGRRSGTCRRPLTLEVWPKEPPPPKKKRRRGLSDMPNSRKSKKAQIRPIRFAKRSDVPCSPVALSSFFFSHMLTSAAWAPPSPVPAKYTVLVVCAPSARTSGTQQTAKRRPRQPPKPCSRFCLTFSGLIRKPSRWQKVMTNF